MMHLTWVLYPELDSPKKHERKVAFEADESYAKLPNIKRRKTTVWHEHLKEFAKSKGDYLMAPVIIM